MNQANTPCIGIIGGMGPRATVRFEEKLVDAFAGTDQLYPDIVCFNIGRVPDRTQFLDGNGPDPVPLLRQISRRAERAGVSVICMPCNTAHAPQILSRLEPSLGVPFLHMPKLTLDLIATKGMSRPMILATDGGVHAGIFDSLRTIYPDPRAQISVMRVIQTIKQGCIPRKRDILAIERAIERAKPDCIVLGCTELSFLASILETNATIIDTLDVLVAECVQYIERSQTCQQKQTVSL